MMKSTTTQRVLAKEPMSLMAKQGILVVVGISLALVSACSDGDSAPSKTTPSPSSGASTSEEVPTADAKVIAEETALKFDDGFSSHYRVVMVGDQCFVEATYGRSGIALSPVPCGGEKY
jgi:hypothetical protein